MHDWAFVTHDVIWRSEFLLVLSFGHNMLYFRRGALSLYTVDRCLEDRSVYAYSSEHRWTILMNVWRLVFSIAEEEGNVP